MRAHGALRTIDTLAFALRVQAAALNRRLKQDMIDQDSSLKPDDLKRISFFQPDASKQAVNLFVKYVEAKWPLRVYAIEPVIAQQNVADAFGRRVQSSLDLAGAAPVAPLQVPGRAGGCGAQHRAPHRGGRDGDSPQSHHGRLRGR